MNEYMYEDDFDLPSVALFLADLCIDCRDEEEALSKMKEVVAAAFAIWTILGRPEDYLHIN